MRIIESKRSAQAGFTLVELMVSVAIMTVITAILFAGLRNMQQRTRVEESKLDLSQNARELSDQFTRDLHQAGYPNFRMYSANSYEDPPSTGTLQVRIDQDKDTAVGIVSYSPTQVVFEGDLDGSGKVQSVRYRLFPGPDGACPCTLQRAQADKIPGSPFSQTVPQYNVIAENVINSGTSETADAPTYTISGGGKVLSADGASYTASTNDSVYSAYKAAPVFMAYNAAGNPVASCDISSAAGRTLVNSIRSIKLTVNMFARTQDLQTGLRPVISVNATARVNNTFQ